MDIIFIHELRIETKIGIYAWEQRIPQTIQLDLEIGLPDGHATTSGAIDDTVDYSEIIARIERLFDERHFPLLETAAEAIAVALRKEFGIPWLKVGIAKLAPSRNAKKVGVTIERGDRN